VREPGLLAALTLLLVLIHRSAWKGNSPKFGSDSPMYCGKIHREFIALCPNEDCRTNQGRFHGLLSVASRSELPRRTMANEDEIRSPEGE
jgi:hypothetical protein